MALGVAIIAFILFCAWRLYAAVQLKKKLPRGREASSRTQGYVFYMLTNPTSSD
ncbi:hypothetical protein CH063_13951 [Colletotrichum higginsianum]|uniref:Uncharacterized protein n=1 Tax=Colletotrichum higginsianum (strain IMI 349063) TaxID=759273 RepID=H1VWJ7_COLHI|nr:hypothetical protein CH063_13951 [Colletotrichum higginsianum]